MDKNFDINSIIPIIEKELNTKVVNSVAIGEGAAGKVYRCEINSEPFAVAIKLAKNESLLIKENNFINFISNLVDIKLPKIYFIHNASESDQANFICMEYFKGISANTKSILYNFKRKKFTLQAVVNLENLHKIKNDKFGPIDNAIFENWHDYYKPFAENVCKFATKKANENKFIKSVAEIMEFAFSNYDKIFDDKIGQPTLIHGDYWTPNLIVNKKTMDLVGVVDPFNVMWADRDYELFTLVAGLGKNLKLYQLYKSRNDIADKCDLKIEFYALFSEVYWYSLTDHKYDSFMIYKAKELKKQLIRFKIMIQ